MDTQFQQKLNSVKDNPKIKKALEVFENAQKTYEQAIDAMTIKQKPRYKGSYSSSLSKEEYYANISTTTKWYPLNDLNALKRLKTSKF